MRQQQTIGRVMTCSGVGLHTGNPAMIKLCPAPPDTGVVFVRHEGGKRIALSASVGNLVPAELCTTISVNGLAVKTVEHVLSALAGLEVDNVFIELDNDEVPVMDGSAEPFVRLIQAAGVVPQDRPQPFLKIMQPIEVVDGAKRIMVEPSSTMRVTYSIQYDHPLIQRQTYSYDGSISMFDRTIASARTFGFWNRIRRATGGRSLAARRRSWRAKRSSSSWRSKPWKPTRPSGSPPRRGRSRPRSKRTSRHGARCRKTCPRDARHPAPCACPTCRGALHRIGEDVTETLDSRRGGSAGSHRRLHVRRPPAALLPGRDL